MKVSQTFGCILLFGALLNSGTCNRTIHPRLTPTTMPVSIIDCRPSVRGVSADTIEVQAGNSVVWSLIDNPYSITIDQKIDSGGNNIAPLTSSIVPTPATVSAPAQLTLPTSATTHTDCSHVGSGSSVQNRGCYFKYNIWLGTAICYDPGIHVIQ